jgi:hypothetical protein
MFKRLFITRRRPAPRRTSRRDPEPLPRMRWY